MRKDTVVTVTDTARALMAMDDTEVRTAVASGDLAPLESTETQDG